MVFGAHVSGGSLVHDGADVLLIDGSFLMYGTLTVNDSLIPHGTLRVVGSLTDLGTRLTRFRWYSR